MHRKWALVVLPMALAVGCSTSSGPGSVSGDESVIASQQAFDGTGIDQLAQYCTQSKDQVESIVSSTLSDLESHGVTDETLDSLTGQLATAASGVGGGKTDCVGIAAAYATLRESPP